MAAATFRSKQPLNSYGRHSAESHPILIAPAITIPIRLYPFVLKDEPCLQKLKETEMNANNPRMFFSGIVVVAIVTSLILAAILVALFKASPVLFGVIFMLAGGAMWFLWLKPFGRSITRDVVSHLHELDQ